MPRYRLFATDLDGTLFGSDLVISDRTRAALQSLGPRGVALVLATGRMFQATLPFAQELGITTPLITYQGAWIRDAKTGVDTWHRVLGSDLAHEALAALEETGLHVNLYVNDQLYVRQLNEAARSYMKLARVDAKQVGTWDEAMAAGGPTKIVAIGPEADVHRWQATLKARFGDRLFIVQSQPTFLEVAGPDVGKGFALARLAEELGVPRAEIVAVGDAMNDLDMLEYAGLGVAMGQAPQELKDRADRVTAPLAEDGVAVLIESLIAEGAL